MSDPRLSDPRDVRASRPGGADMVPLRLVHQTSSPDQADGQAQTGA